MMTPDLQMTTEEFFGRAEHPPAPYGLIEAWNLLEELDRVLQPKRPSFLEISEDKLTVTVMVGSHIVPFHLEARDYSRPGVDVARDILQLMRGGRL